MSAGEKWGGILIYVLQTVPSSCGHHRLRHHVVAGTKIERGNTHAAEFLGQVVLHFSARETMVSVARRLAVRQRRISRTALLIVWQA